MSSRPDTVSIPVSLFDHSGVDAPEVAPLEAASQSAFEVPMGSLRPHPAPRLFVNLPVQSLASIVVQISRNICLFRLLRNAMRCR